MTNVVRLNAYDDAKRTEARGLGVLKPYLSLIAHEGRWMWAAHNSLAQTIQRAGVDILIAGPSDIDWSMDCKFSENHADIPFESWSNRVLLPGYVDEDFRKADDVRYMIDYRRSTRGWGITSRADLILIYDVVLDRGFVGRLAAWRELLYRRQPSGLCRWQLYDRRRQIKRRQLNDSWVIWTPPSDLVKHAGFQQFSVKQLGLWDQPELILRLAAAAPEAT